MQILDALYYWCRASPERPAFIQQDGVTTYHALAQGVERIAEYFARSVPDRSRPILISLTTAPKALLVSLGLLRANFSIIIADPLIFDLLPKNAANTLVHEQDGPRLADATNILFDESWLTIGISNLQEKVPAFFSSKATTADISFLLSGERDHSGRIMRTQAFAQDALHTGALTAADFDRVMMLLGVNNSIGLARAYQCLGSGKSLCFALPGPTMPWMIDTFSIDTVVASPDQAVALSQLQETVTRYPLKSLKRLCLCGPALPPNDMTLIKNHLCRNVFVEYSPQETGPIAMAPHDMIADIPDAVGFVLPHADVQIVDAEGRLMQTDTEGFVRVRTPQLLRNFQIADSTTWFYTGYMGRRTDSHILCVTRPAPGRAATADAAPLPVGTAGRQGG